MLTGHASHQIGLDADIWYMAMPGKTMSWTEREFKEPLQLAELNGTRVIKGNWREGYYRVLRQAARYGEVERILVHPAVKPFLKPQDERAPSETQGWPKQPAKPSKGARLKRSTPLVEPEPPLTKLAIAR